MALDRLRVAWNGFPGGPGVSTFYGTVGSELAADARTFFDAIKSIIPTDVTLTFPGVGDQIEPATGEISGSWSTTAPAPVVGTGAVVYGAPVGMMVSWLTDGIVAGHRVRGRTFIVPTIANYTSGGVANSTMVSTLNSAAAAFLGGDSTLSVWARPKLTTPTRDGTAHVITGSTVSPKLVVLRSRRD